MTALISAGSTCQVAAFCSTSASICAGGTGADTTAGAPLPGASGPPGCRPSAGFDGFSASASALAKRGAPGAAAAGDRRRAPGRGGAGDLRDPALDRGDVCEDVHHVRVSASRSSAVSVSRGPDGSGPWRRKRSSAASPRGAAGEERIGGGDPERARVARFVQRGDGGADRPGGRDDAPAAAASASVRLALARDVDRREVARRARAGRSRRGGRPARRARPRTPDRARPARRRARLRPG